MRKKNAPLIAVLLTLSLYGVASATAVTVTLTPSTAFNPICGNHTVTATVNPNGNTIGSCTGGSNAGTPCADNSVCTGGGTCSFDNYTVFFKVTSGPNAGDTGSATTDSSGVATFQYTSNCTAGEDSIASCVDLDARGFVDDTGFDECAGDSPGEGDLLSNTVDKFWLENFVTGGGTVGKNPSQSASGTVGPNPLSNGTILGEWEEHSQSGKSNVNCHWDSFTFLSFSGSATTSPPSTHNEADFTTAAGRCNDKAGSTPIVNVKVVDNGEPGGGVDVLGVCVVSGDPTPSLQIGDCSGGVPSGTTIDNGNFQVHDINP